MPFPEDPLDPANNAVDRVRLLVGDVDSGDLEMVEALYVYFLDNNSQDEALAAIQALKALVSKYAKAMNEIVGDVEVDLQQRYKGYSDLLDKFLKDPSYSLLGAITPYAGGLSFNEKRTDALNKDLRTSNFTVGGNFRKASVGYDSPFYKDQSDLNDPIIGE